jgi:hypothetical protein
MGKAGKNRKRQRLANGVAYLGKKVIADTADCEDDVDDSLTDVDDSGNPYAVTDNDCATAIDLLDNLAANIPLFKSSTFKPLRVALHPFVKEQKDKHFERRKLAQVHHSSESLVESIDFLQKVLSYFASNLELFRSKLYKQFRSALHPLIQELNGTGTKHTSQPTNLPAVAVVSSQLQVDSNETSVTQHKAGFSGRISTHFQLEEWTLALEVLEEMRLAKQAPKLGALQRWVREADLAPFELRFPLIDAILRVVVLLDKTLPVHPETEVFIPVKDRNPNPTYFPPFEIPNANPPSNTARKTSRVPITKEDYRIIHTVPAIDRPSKTDLNMYTLTKGRFILKDISNTAQESSSIRANVPGVPGAFVMTNVLSHDECDQWLEFANAIGYAPDTVVGINHVLWLAEDDLIHSLFKRCKRHLPSHIDGCELTGINARLRFFRYEPGAAYRVHIDGAWPGSGFVNNYATNGDEYTPVDDAFGDRYSRLTFLVYLNDGFEGGHTTYFTPNLNNIGELEARSIKPLKGSIACFPHGDAIGSLAHEGSSVITGAKYVIRTEVLYMLPKTGRHGSNVATSTSTQ